MGYRGHTFVTRVASCFNRFVVATLTVRKAAVMLEFRVNSVVNGLRVAAATGLVPGCPLDLHRCTSFLLPHWKVPSIAIQNEGTGGEGAFEIPGR